MNLIALGISHKTSAVELREKLATLTSDVVICATGVSGAIVVATCNRTEFYVETESAHELLSWLSVYLELDSSAIKKYIYVYSDLDAVRHLMQVACGLDSMVLGEVEILGQLKAAYKLALQQEYVTKRLNKLFECAFSVAKKVRTQTEISSNPVSVAYLAVRLAERIFTHISEQVVLLIGAGDTAQLMVKHLSGAGVKNFIIANRTLTNSQALARTLDDTIKSELIELHMVPDCLMRADIVVTTTSAPLPIVGKGMVEQAIKARKYRSMFMIDLSVPRNIEPQVQQIADVYLYGIDDLQTIAAEHRQSRHTAIPQAETIIACEVNKFMAWLDSQKHITTINAFRRRCEIYRDQALHDALRQLSNGIDPKQVMQRFAHLLLNKLLHEPTVQLRKASVAGNIELLSTIRELLEI